MGHCCEPDEFECNYPADGCIPRYKVRDGNIDCIRDAYDESIEAFKQLIQVYPEGETVLSIFRSSQISHDWQSAWNREKTLLRACGDC